MRCGYMVLQKFADAPNISLVSAPPKREIPLVNIGKNLLLASSFFVGAGLAQGQNTVSFEFTANAVGNYRQVPDGVFFDGGLFDMDIRDGFFLYGPPICESTQFFTPGGPCPIGATGWVSRGLENDPLLNGLGPYFSVTSIGSATLLRPFDATSVRLNAAPPSLLPRPLAGFNDLGLSVFYNLQTPLIRQYFISRYDFRRQYTRDERNRFDGEIVPGRYEYNFPSLASTTIPLVLAMNLFPKLDGYRKINSQPQGFRFLNVTYDDGFAVLNPYDLNVISWEGNTNTLIFPGTDNLFFSIKPLANPADPLSDPVQYDGQGPLVIIGNAIVPNPTIPLFPNFVGSSDARVLLPSPLDKSFILPPNFLDPGQSGIIDMEFDIYRPTSAVIYEETTRRFRMPVRVLNPFANFIQASLPPGATSQQMAADYDYDGDGFSNFTEWVFKSNPGAKGSLPGLPTITSSSPTPSEGQVASKSTTGETPQSVMEYKVAKLTNSVPKLEYAIEYSKDMVTWNEITSGNPSWILTETYNEIKVTGSATNPDKGGFFRTKVQPLN